MNYNRDNRDVLRRTKKLSKSLYCDCPRCVWMNRKPVHTFWKGNVPVDAIEMTALNEAMYGYSDWEQGHPELHGYPDMQSCP